MHPFLGHPQASRRSLLGLVRPARASTAKEAWLALDAALATPDPIMVVGAPDVASELERRGHQVTTEETTDGALQHLAWRRHRAVVVEPALDGALRFVELVKATAPEQSPAARLHGGAPLFVLPFAGEHELWIVIEPTEVLLVDTERVSLFTCWVEGRSCRLASREHAAPAPG